MSIRKNISITILVALQFGCFLSTAVLAKGIENTLAQDPVANIIGGSEAQPGAWPWMVALVWTDSGSVFDNQFCGGALINSQWVLTAAGCVTDETTSSMQVVAGVHDLVNDSGQKIGVKRIIQHPNYNVTTADYDFALLELVSKSSLATLPLFSGYSSTDVPGTLAGETGTITGWGNTSTTGYIWPEKMQQAALPIISNTVCEASYPGEITRNMLCAGYSSGDKDSCTGDKGGPLMVQVERQWVHAGVVSWGEGCGLKYGVYARTSAVMDFIKQYIPEASFIPAPPKGLPWLLLLKGN